MTTQQQTRQILTAGQLRSLNTLKHEYGLSEAALARCRFFSQADEPWIPPDLLQSIALQIGSFTYVGISFNQYVRELEQQIWNAKVIDADGRTFERCGVATIGEEHGGEVGDEVVSLDTHALAQGRALQAALSAAGFHPFKAGFRSAYPTRPALSPAEDERLSEEEIELHKRADASELRGKDLRQIHALAEECGLIIGKDQRSYRAWLAKEFRSATAATLNAAQRASVINALLNYDMVANLANVPDELRADAMIA